MPNLAWLWQGVVSGLLTNVAWILMLWLYKQARPVRSWASGLLDGSEEAYEHAPLIVKILLNFVCITYELFFVIIICSSQFFLFLFVMAICLFLLEQGRWL